MMQVMQVMAEDSYSLPQSRYHSNHDAPSAATFSVLGLHVHAT